ncbi:hypothetical protein [Persicobacter sp. CCB-QB2]|uniref:hypothetical protein n=1 Tax=Persicobacter sp. CCB-QB2 TaxID=1561025 RepID=UPI0006A97FD2|nr:hypothetical protein [Persicobacter sp. CCB-QB2]
MKKLSLLILALFCFTACSEEPSPSITADLLESREAWGNFKKEHANTYSFTSTTSSFTSLQTASTLIVSNGVVIRKDYYAQYRDDNGDLVEERFQETGGDIGLSPKGIRPMTMDEIYDLAETEWLKPEVPAEVFFEVDHLGILSKAGYQAEGCIDDCFKGITIEKITAL